MTEEFILGGYDIRATEMREDYKRCNEKIVLQ